jgi:HPt (histidine-containing phosphotransfer) domain-containing protein
MEQERELAKVFMDVGEDCLKVFRAHLAGSRSLEEWKMAAHKLKGSAAQLGAGRLSDTCRAAEETPNGSLQEKETLLHDIQAFFDEVRDFFQRRHSHLGA